MTDEKKAIRMENLEDWAVEWNISIKEAAWDLVVMFYEVEGFADDRFLNEMNSKSEAELIEIYLEI